MSERRRSGQYTLYKKIGAAQFSLIGPTYSDEGFVKRDGCVFLEMAPGIPGQEKSWNWAQKITFGIGIADIALFMDSDSGYVKLTHDAGTDTESNIKNLELKPGEGKYAGTFMLSLYQKQGEETRKASVGVSAGEYQVLMRLLSTAIPVILGWQE